MKVIFLILCALTCTIALPRSRSNNRIRVCDESVCKPPDCRCSSFSIPGGLHPKDTPQMVLLTFDDAVNILNIEYYRKLLADRKNPNNCPISATYFVTHEYTDYSLVNELHLKGNDIALHSISHTVNIDYWRDASVETLRREFADQRTLMSKFANIPQADIKGIRMPFLQMSGNNQFNMMNNSDFLYDISWPTLRWRQPGLWPYSMTYSTIQDCPIGVCPDESYSKVWVIPMIQWDNDVKNQTCSMIDACTNHLGKTRANNTFEWMKTEFLKQYNGNRAPIGLYLHAAWFAADEKNFEGYLMFLDYLKTLPDVYLSSGTQVIDWVKTPKTVAEMKTTPCKPNNTPQCNARSCQLRNEDGNERWMVACTNCPIKYPWIGNPLGE